MSEFQIMNLENTEVTEWNFAAIKGELQLALESYAGLVYTDDTIKDAKKDRRDLNKAKKIMEDARKAYKAKCLEPYEALEPQIKELVKMVDSQIELIEETVKDFDNRQREAKEAEIRKYYDRKAEILGSLADVLYPAIFDRKWTNASTSRVKYEDAILNAINSAAEDIKEIRSWNSCFVDSLLSEYAATLSLDGVKEKNEELIISAEKAGLTDKSAQGMQALKAMAETDEKDADNSVVMRVYGSQSQMNQLTDFMKAVGIRYELL